MPGQGQHKSLLNSGFRLQGLGFRTSDFEESPAKLTQTESKKTTKRDAATKQECERARCIRNPKKINKKDRETNKYFETKDRNKDTQK